MLAPAARMALALTTNSPFESRTGQGMNEFCKTRRICFAALA
jgi:hypothetical protein